MDGITFFFVLVIVVCFLMAILKATVWGKHAENAVSLQKVQSSYSPEQSKFIQTASRLFGENRIMTLLEVYEECGMPHSIVYSKDANLIQSNVPFVKGSDGDNVFKTYAYSIDKRHSLAYLPLVEHSNDGFRLNLQKDEKIYHVIYHVVLHEQKRTVTNISYSGVRWQSGLLRAGSLAVMASEITHFVAVDAGKLVFTNRRIIFIGSEKNITKQIKYSDILFNNLYQDGVLVNIPNRKPLLFKFIPYQDFECYQLSDGVNEFVIAYDRMIKKNFNQNLSASQQDSTKLGSISIIEALAAKNIDSLVAEVIKLAKVGEMASTSAIQRKFSIGYSRAGGIMDLLEDIGILSPYVDGIRKWLVDASDEVVILSKIDNYKPAE